MDSPSKNRRERILHERAEALAHVIDLDSETGDHLDVTIFSIGAERYAIDSKLVREIIPLSSLMPLPCVPDHIAGIFNLRGKLLAAVDLRKLLGIPSESEQIEENLVVLKDGGMEFGLLADSIEGVLSLPLTDIQDNLVAKQSNGAKYLRGVTRDRLVLLDGLRLIHDPDLVVNDETI